MNLSPPTRPLNLSPPTRSSGLLVASACWGLPQTYPGGAAVFLRRTEEHLLSSFTGLQACATSVPTSAPTVALFPFWLHHEGHLGSFQDLTVTCSNAARVLVQSHHARLYQRARFPGPERPGPGELRFQRPQGFPDRVLRAAEELAPLPSPQCSANLFISPKVVAARGHRCVSIHTYLIVKFGTFP